MTFDKVLLKVKSPESRLKAVKNRTKVEHSLKTVKLNIKLTEDANVSLGIFVVIPRCRPMKAG